MSYYARKTGIWGSGDHTMTHSRCLSILHQVETLYLSERLEQLQNLILTQSRRETANEQLVRTFGLPHAKATTISESRIETDELLRLLDYNLLSSDVGPVQLHGR